jgi:excisionase family DNA binding protein
MKKFLSPAEVADELGGAISRSTIWRGCQDGTIPAVQIGTRWLISATYVNDIKASLEHRWVA